MALFTPIGLFVLPFVWLVVLADLHFHHDVDRVGVRGSTATRDERSVAAHARLRRPARPRYEHPCLRRGDPGSFGARVASLPPTYLCHVLATRRRRAAVDYAEPPSGVQYPDPTAHRWSASHCCSTRCGSRGGGWFTEVEERTRRSACWLASSVTVTATTWITSTGRDPRRREPAPVRAARAARSTPRAGLCVHRVRHAPHLLRTTTSPSTPTTYRRRWRHRPRTSASTVDQLVAAGLPVHEDHDERGSSSTAGGVNYDSVLVGPRDPDGPSTPWSSRPAPSRYRRPRCAASTTPNQNSQVSGKPASDRGARTTRCRTPPGRGRFRQGEEEGAGPDLRHVRRRRGAARCGRRSHDVRPWSDALGRDPELHRLRVGDVDALGDLVDADSPKR